jgi:hypothetical protein
MTRTGAVFGGVLLAFLALPAPARPDGRELLVLNRGSEAIFAVQIGHAKTQTWSEDMLPFNDVVDVGEGKEVPLPAPKDCVYDVRATYRDRSTSDLTNVDICTANSVSFDH